MTDLRLIWTVKAFCGGFALGLVLALICDARPEVALPRAFLSGIVLAAVTLMAGSLNKHAPAADESDG